VLEGGDSTLTWRERGSYAHRACAAACRAQENFVEEKDPDVLVHAIAWHHTGRPSCLDREIEQYREAAILTLEQLEWIGSYLHRIGKSQLAAALDRNRKRIIERIAAETRVAGRLPGRDCFD
jgi:hypothetical protein